MITLHHEKETDFTKNGYGSLDKNIVNPEVYWEMNSEFKFSFEYPLFSSNEEIIRRLSNRNLVRVPVPYMDDQFFRIYRTKEVLGYIRVEARHLFYDLIDNLIEDTNIVGKNGLGALTQLLNATQYTHKFNAFSDIDSTANMRIVRYNPVKALLDDSEDNTYVNRWGGELYRDNYNIHMRKRIGTSRGIKVEHKKDLLGYEATIDESTIATRIMPKGFDGLLLPEKYVDSPLLDPDNPKIRVVEYSDVMAAIGDYEDYEDAIPLSEAYEELRRLAREEFSIHHVDEPETVIHVDFITLENTKEYEEFSELQEIHQGDTVQVSVPEQGFEITSRLVAFTSDPLRKNHYTSTTLGNHVLEYTTSRTEIDVIRKEIKNTNELITITRQAANGKNSNFWGTADPNTLDLNAQIDDTYFQEDGDYFAIWEYVEVNGERYWRKGPNTDFGKEISNQLKEAVEDIEQAQATADNAITEISTAIDAAGFDTLADSLTGIQSISQTAQSNSIEALGTAQDSMNTAMSALNSVTEVITEIENIDIRVDEVEGSLSLKADKQVVDALAGIVDTHTTDIQANAQGLALKANQSTVDTLAGTVQSLGTNFDIVAGQVNSRVWNTDIQTAIDGIEVGGRNYWAMSKEPWHSYLTHQGDGVFTNRRTTSSYAIYNMNKLEVPVGDTYTASFEINVSDEAIQFSNGVFYVNGAAPNVRHNRPILVKDEWVKVHATFKYTVENTNPVHIYISGIPALHTIQFRNFQLEKGNVVTDWTPAPEDTTALINHVETELTQKHDSITATVSSIDGRVATNTLNLDGAITRVGNAEGRLTTVETNISGIQTTVASKASQSEVTQLSNLLSSTVEDVEGNTTQISQNATNINLRVTKGELLSQINIEAGRTLIQSDRLLLNANNTVITGTAWMDGAVIANASIDGAKIQDATIGSAKIASLDASKISTGTLDGIAITGVTITGSTFIQESSLAGSTYGRWDRTGITLRDSAGTMIMDINREGINFHGTSTETAGTYINNNLIDVQKAIIYDLNVTGMDARLRGASFAGNIHVGNISTGTGHGVRFTGQTVPAPLDRMLWVGYGYDGNGIYQYFGGWRKLALSSNTSDARLKNVIGTSVLNSLETIMTWEFVDFEWKDTQYYSEGTQFGLIAQNTKEIGVYHKSVDRWEIDTQKQTMMNSHAIQQVGLRELNTNKIASQALQATESNSQKIERLEKRIEELEGVA